MHSKDDILIKQVAKNLDQEFSYHVNLLKNETLFADFLHNYFLGLTPTDDKNSTCTNNFYTNNYCKKITGQSRFWTSLPDDLKGLITTMISKNPDAAIAVQATYNLTIGGSIDFSVTPNKQLTAIRRFRGVPDLKNCLYYFFGNVSNQTASKNVLGNYVDITTICNGISTYPTYIINIYSGNQVSAILASYKAGFFTPLTDSYNSLLKFEKPDDDLSLDCLSGRLSPSLNYILVFPVHCDERVANAYFCSMSYYECIISDGFRLRAQSSTETTVGEQVDLFVDPAYASMQENQFITYENQVNKIFKHMDMTSAYKAIFSTLWYTSLPCFDLKGLTAENDGQRSLLKYCKWNGLAIPCSAIFTTFPTEQGMCCSFNMKAADDIFIGETYTKMIQDLQESDRKISLNRGKLPSDYIKNGEPKAQPGKSRGLTVVLDGHSDIISVGSVKNDTYGFLGLLQPSGSFPTTNLGAFDIRPGHKNNVAITGIVVKSAPELYNLAFGDRNCYFNNENSQLKLYKNYTQSNCFFECSLNITKDAMNHTHNIPCIPWFIPTVEKYPKICNPWEAVKFVDIMSNVPQSKCPNCLPDCTVTVYKTLVTAVPLRNCSLASMKTISFCNTSANTQSNSTMMGNLLFNNYNERIRKMPRHLQKIFPISSRNLGSSLEYGHYFGPSDSVYNAFSRDIAVVNVYFKTATAIEIKRQPVMTWTDFFSNIGGLLGLVLGIGLLTVMELIWLSYQIGIQILPMKRHIINVNVN